MLPHHKSIQDVARAALPDTSRCDSPIEDLFYYDFQKVIAENAIIHRQVECPTPIGTFRLDFLLQLPHRRVGFECDGKDFHDAEKDAVRDRAIIDAGHADRIYRLSGHDIHCHLHDALDLIAAQDKELFSDRGRANIKVLASRHYERLEDTVYPDVFFQFAATRYYGRIQDPDDDSISADPPPKPQMPTRIYWTQKKP